MKFSILLATNKIHPLPISLLANILDDEYFIWEENLIIEDFPSMHYVHYNGLLPRTCNFPTSQRQITEGFKFTFFL